MYQPSRLAFFYLPLLFVTGCGAGNTLLQPDPTHAALERIPSDSPVLVFESDANFMGNETPSKRFPRFVLYGSGQVISLSVDSSVHPYSTVVLSRAEATDVLQSTHFSELLEHDGATFVASRGTDAGRLILSLRRDDGTYARIVVWGWRTDKYPSQPEADFPPLALFQAIQQLDRFRDPRAVEWSSSEYELYSWPCGYAGKYATPWPQEWQLLPKDAPTSGPRWNVTRLVGVDAGKVSDSLGPSITTAPRTVHAGGKQWCLCYRPVFPGEANWRTDGPVVASGAN